ncbi:MAG: SMC family ATPase, partial [Dehalococcoidia bacterium]|nr:SMC family ATPase [Dehalococcoidia bacterium]
MIPLLLTLRNFMCYREKMPPLSFESFHLACLSGANGHGKSALLDAITWALWGESRAKDDDELIHQGQIEMEVDFEFAVGEQRYRVIRKHAMAGPRRTRQASLELQVATPEGFKSITGDSRQQTQQKLLDLLRMDYQTFINSSFLIQGRANEFSLKQPAQRKEVLSSILGLSFYDKVGEGAREMARSRQGEGENLEKSIADIDVELGKRDEYESEFEKARVHVQRLEGEVQAREAELHKLRSERDSLEGGRVTLLETEKRLHNDSLELIRRQGQVKEHRSKIEAYEGLLQERERLERGYQQFLAARKSVDEWNERLQQYTRVREEVVVLEKEIARAREDVAAEVKISRSWFSQESAKSAQLPAFERQLAELKAQLEGLTHSEEAHRQKNLRMQELQSHVTGLRSESVRLGRETKAVQEKLALLLHGEARCPLCETELGVDGIGRLESKYRDELLSGSEAVKANLAEQQGLSGQQEEIAREIGQLEKLISRQVENKQRAVLIEKGIHEAGEASGKAVEWGKKLAGLERVLEMRDYVHPQQTALRERESQLGELGYDNGKHGEAQKLLKKCEGYEAAYRALDEADKVLPQVRQSLGMAEEEVARLEREMESDSVRVEVLKKELSSLPQ